MKKTKDILTRLFKTGFVKSVVTRVLAIFIIVSVIITAVTFFSFTSEIRRGVLDDRLKMLSAAEQTISDRMYEIGRIAYSIEHDPEIYAGSSETDVNMKNNLSRYLGGNTFIEHLALCRTAQPDIIYTAKGERSLKEFFTATLGMKAEIADAIIADLHAQSSIEVMLVGEGQNSYFGYLYPIPLTDTPLAHVMMLIPAGKVKPILDDLLLNGNGEAAVFDADGKVIYHGGSGYDEIDLSDFIKGNSEEKDFESSSGTKYVVQKVVSNTNQWTYVLATRYSDTLSGLASKQLLFIIIVLLVLLCAITIMLISIIAQYKPIRKIAAELEAKNDGKGGADERTLLSETIATLQVDSDQKQKYETAYYEAEAASKAKSAFLSSMSHDIRTPMNAIIGMTALARKHIDNQTYVDECLKKVQVSSDYLLDIINNVLDMSRIESGRIPISVEPLLLPTLIDSVVSLMTSSAEAKSQIIDADISGIRQSAVYGDNVHMVQVFVNILSNAVKFTPEGGKLGIKVTQSDSDDAGYGNYIFAFSDTGVGIPPEFIGHVFETFSRAENAVKSKEEGTGLGMAIAKKLVELMGGTITCESEADCGTTFTVTVKLKYATEEDAALLMMPINKRSKCGDADDEIVNLKGKHILLAEDNAINSEIAINVISETGAEITSVKNGKEAVDAFGNSEINYFDLVFMDIQMPVMNGYEATHCIRAMDRADAETVPIYAMTANTFDEDVRNVKEAGMNGHIGKPYVPTDIYAVLSRAFGSDSKHL